MNKEKKKLLMSAAVTGLLLTAGCASAPKSEAGKVVGECHGINACKGMGDCGSKVNMCAGKNACKGLGWKRLSKAKCGEKGGSFKEG